MKVIFEDLITSVTSADGVRLLFLTKEALSCGIVPILNASGQPSEAELNAKPVYNEKEVEAEKDELEEHAKDKMQAIEIRRSCDSKSHQTSIITTVRTSKKELLASHTEQTKLNEELAELQQQRKELLEDRKNTPKHIKLSDIPEAQRPKLISHTRRQFLITSQRIRRGSFESVKELERAIADYIKQNNDDPKPFVWTKSAEQIFDKITDSFN